LKFYAVTEFEEWKNANKNKKFRAKYLKGLGTSTAKEAKEYFDPKNK
jgi:DNA topoisomerase-2